MNAAPDICRHRWPTALDDKRHIMPHLCSVPASVGDHTYHECVCGDAIDVAEVTA